MTTVAESHHHKPANVQVVTMNAALHALAGGSHHAAARNLLGQGVGSLGRDSCSSFSKRALARCTGKMPAFQLQPDCWSFTAVMTACTRATCDSAAASKRSKSLKLSTVGFAVLNCMR